MQKVIKKYKERNQFYTNKKLVKYCIKVIKKFINLDEYTVIEPSAGNGRFLKYLPIDTIAMDIIPKHKK